VQEFIAQVTAKSNFLVNIAVSKNQRPILNSCTF